MGNIYMSFFYLFFLNSICLKVSAYVEIVIQNPVLYKEENMSVICRPDAAHRDSIERVRMIRVYVEHDGGRIGSDESQMSKIVNSTKSYPIEHEDAKTERYIVTGKIRRVNTAYLEVFVNARDVMCSDSRLFRCEMDFILKNKTEATDIKDGVTCIKGPCNTCRTYLAEPPGLLDLNIRPEIDAENFATRIKDPLILVGVGLGVLGILSLVCGVILFVKSKKSKIEVTGTLGNTSPGLYENNSTLHANSEEAVADRGRVHYITTFVKRPDENLYTSLN
uniref:Uncharacterized protein LOC111123173 n=1 Tax=Crassostrea virginica TaxID=6565 RepID=A0A8B8D0K9_CRAVI|nr:uncharacterized protein LOC111123173 [Crassostrea virginica]